MLATKILSPFFFLGMRILAIFVYFITILSAFGGRINPDYFSFPSLLSLVFPYFAIITILLVVFWGITRRIFFCALGIITIVICLTPLSEVCPLGHSRKPSEGAQVFKIISWNVLHTRDLRKPDYPGNRALEYIIDSDADIVCLTELMQFVPSELPHLTDNLKDSLFKAYPYYSGLENTDIKILSKYPVERIGKICYDVTNYCRYDFFKINFPEEKELLVAMVHLSSYGLSAEERMVVTEINSVESAKTSMQEFKGPIHQKLRAAFRNRAEDATHLRSAIDDISENIPLIVCGDFNDVPTSWTYNLIRGDDMRDAYVETNFGPAITYNLHAFYFHIDQMLYRGPIEALDLTVGKINSSDHYPLIGTFEFK